MSKANRCALYLTNSVTAEHYAQLRIKRTSRTLTRAIHNAKACRLVRLRDIRTVSLSAKQEKEFSWVVGFDSSTLLRPE